MSMELPDAPVSEEWEGRHPSVKHFAPLFEYDHLPVDLQEISVPFGMLAESLLTMCHDGPELSAALRKLVEAKDCAVRQRVLDRKAEQA